MRSRFVEVFEEVVSEIQKKAEEVFQRYNREYIYVFNNEGYEEAESVSREMTTVLLNLLKKSMSRRGYTMRLDEVYFSEHVMAVFLVEGESGFVGVATVILPRSNYEKGEPIYKLATVI